MSKNSLSIEYRDVSDLKEYGGNPRAHNRAQRRKLHVCLEKFGQIAPIIIDDKNVVIDGHAVLKAWAALGNDQIAVVVVRGRDEADVKALRLALNRISEDTKWNPTQLKAEIEGLVKIQYDLSVTGFEQVEIDMTLATDVMPSGAVEDGVPAPNPSALAITKPGNLWLLGPHRIICGDSRSPHTLTRLMGSTAAQMVFTDPPYNVQIQSISGLGKHKHREFAMASGEMTRSQFTTFLQSFFDSTILHVADGGLIYVCMDWKHQRELLTAADNLGLQQLNLCVWAKSNPGMGTFYRSAHELIHIFKKGAAPHINNFELGKKGYSRANVWNYRGMNVPGAERDELLALHPTVKPLALVVDAIKDVTHRNAVVLDPFLGSGTTIIAAEATGRCGHGVELDPLYVDTAIRRWQSRTGEQAVLAGTNMTFDELEEQSFRSEQLLLPPPSRSSDEEK